MHERESSFLPSLSPGVSSLSSAPLPADALWFSDCLSHSSHIAMTTQKYPRNIPGKLFQLTQQNQGHQTYGKDMDWWNGKEYNGKRRGRKKREGEREMLSESLTLFPPNLEWNDDGWVFKRTKKNRNVRERVRCVNLFIKAFLCCFAFEILKLRFYIRGYFRILGCFLGCFVERKIQLSW